MQEESLYNKIFPYKNNSTRYLYIYKNKNIKLIYILSDDYLSEAGYMYFQVLNHIHSAVTDMYIFLKILFWILNTIQFIIYVNKSPEKAKPTTILYNEQY